MKIAFFTLPRTPEYLPGTLRSLVARDPAVRPDQDVALFFDGRTAPELPFPLAHVELATAERLTALRGNPLAATHNYLRALFWLSRAMQPGKEWPVVLACEDDLEFAERVTERVAALGALATRSVGRNWLLSLHHLYPRESFRCVATTDFGDRLLRWADVSGFYASQAMAMPADVAFRLFTELYRHAGHYTDPAPADWGKWNMDMGLKACCREMQIPLFTVDPCLIQHVGDVSVAIPGRPPLRNQYFRARL